VAGPRGELGWAVLAVVAAGGMAGALARFWVQSVWPSAPGGFAWATFVINVSGCLLIGALMVAITEVRVVHRLVRPFLGVGFLGGYTTFSAYVADIRRMVAHGAPVTALAYLAGTMVAAVAATWCGMALARLVARAAAR
jgi:fluoride exporter